MLARVPLCDKNPLLVDSQTVWPITAIRAGKTTLKKRERREMEKSSKKKKKKKKQDEDTENGEGEEDGKGRQGGATHLRK